MRLLILLIIIFSASAFAEPVVTIRSVDPEHDGQKIKVRFNINSPDRYRLYNIDEENIQLFEDNFRVNYVRLEKDAAANQPVYFAIVTSTVCGKGENSLNARKNIIKALISQIHGRDKIALFSLSSSMKVVAGFNTNKKEKLFALAEIERGVKTSGSLNYLYDAISSFKDISSHNKRIIVVGDCSDLSGSVSPDDLIAQAKERGVSIYFIFLSRSGQKTASRLAKLTGGEVFCSSDFRDEASYKRITTPSSIGYIATYISMLGFDGNRHTVELRLNSGEIRDRSRSEFYISKRSFDIDKFFKSEGVLHIIVFIIMILIMAIMFFIGLRMIIFNRKKVMPEVVTTDPEYPPIASTVNSGRMISDAIDKNKPEDVPFQNVMIHSSEDQKYSSAWLILKNGFKNDKIFITGDLTIGSDETNSIIVNDSLVSSKHAAIRKIKGGFFLFDLVSDSGVILNGKKLLRPRALYDWDEIVIAKTRIIFRGANFSENQA